MMGLIGLTAASIAPSRHLDFVSGFGTAFGTGALIVFILSMRREPQPRE